MLITGVVPSEAKKRLEQLSMKWIFSKIIELVYSNSRSGGTARKTNLG